MKKYENILFDLDMTLLDFNTCEYNALKKTFFSYGVEIDGEKHKTYAQINDKLWKRLERGEIVKKDLGPMRFKMFLDYLGMNEEPSVIDKEYKDNLSLEAVLMEKVKETCEKLSKDYNLYVITNGTDYIQKSRMKLSGLNPFFKGMITSDEAGFPKPQKEFFDFFFNKTKADKSSCLIVGDSLTSDILGGVNYGIDTCLISDNKPSGEIQPDYYVKSIELLINLLQQ